MDTSSFIKNFPGHDRFDFPGYIERVTGGNGGEALLIFGREKTALYDTGMAYCAKRTIDNIRMALAKHGRDSVDVILLSHTHYDHIGGLGYILKSFPNATVYGSPVCSKVFASEGALATMKRLGEAAARLYTGKEMDIEVGNFRMDIPVYEGDHIDMGGGEFFYVIETKGHTNCCITYVFEPEKVMFTSESTGVLRSPELLTTEMLKSYGDSVEAGEKCRDYGANRVIVPHYGILPEDKNEFFFNKFLDSAKKERDIVVDMCHKGASKEEIMDVFESMFWSEERASAQPKDAFLENLQYKIAVLMREA